MYPVTSARVTYLNHEPISDGWASGKGFWYCNNWKVANGQGDLGWPQRAEVKTKTGQYNYTCAQTMTPVVADTQPTKTFVTSIKSV